MATGKGDVTTNGTTYEGDGSEPLVMGGHYGAGYGSAYRRYRNNRYIADED